MKNFSIDSQTFKDLNIFTESTSSNSIFNLFKGTRTLGARERLKEIMESPSSDLRDITLRRDAIKYFHDHKINVDIRNEELDLIAFYLKSEKRKSRSNLIDAVADYATRNSSNDYYIIKTGLKYLIKLIKYLSDFIRDNTSDNTPPYLVMIFEKITAIIGEGLLKDAILMNGSNLKFFQVNKFDHAFRGAEKENIQTLLQLVYELDIFENVSMVALRLGLSFPEYEDKENLEVRLTGLFHPGIRNPVKNDVVFNKDQNIVFLTGSNMAGKSSLLKSLGLVIYLSHLGFPVPANHMKTTIFNGLMTTINLPDDIHQGLSHYYSEVRRVKEVALKLEENDRMFVIFDELFRGTNVKDAFDASLLIISELSNIKHSAFFISTHIVELAEELKKFQTISFRYLETFFKEDKPVFTYKLLNGISKERVGLFIVQNEGIVEIIRRAHKN
jgi:DNA mismatch repair protein MutS